MTDGHKIDINTIFSSLWMLSFLLKFLVLLIYYLLILSRFISFIIKNNDITKMGLIGSPSTQNRRHPKS